MSRSREWKEKRTDVKDEEKKWRVDNQVLEHDQKEEVCRVFRVFLLFYLIDID